MLFIDQLMEILISINSIQIIVMKLLKDPKNTRICKELPLPPQFPLNSSSIFQTGGFINWRCLRKFLEKEGKIRETDFQKLIKIATMIFKSQPNLIYLDDPVTIVGDIHGQFYDFLKIISPEVGGNPDSNNYLFLGDYVDRGNFSIQVMILIISIKICHSRSFFMLRGNHECRHLTSYFNFRQQCLKKYNQHIYEMLMEMFDALPLACVVNRRFLCVHGGISHQIKNLDDIKRLDRFKQIPKSGIFCDLVWSDPIDFTDGPSGKLNSIVIPNETRGCSYFFGQQLSNKFLNHNRLVSVIRAHQPQAQGFRTYKWSGPDKIPAVITIFSAPNYCDYYGNKGAVINFIDNTLNIKQFFQSPHPYILPNFLDLFSWSIPFVVEKVTELLYHIIGPNKQQENLDEIAFWLAHKKKLVQSILFETKKNTQQNISLVKLNGNCPDNKLLETGKYRLVNEQGFVERKMIDIQNQSRPQ